MNRKIVLFLGALITLSVETDSSPAESPVYGLKGTSVRLTVESLQHLKIRRIKWRLNSNEILEHTVVNNDTQFNNEYKRNAQFDSRDFSLLIKNLDETDQGTYIAKITETNGAESEKVKYRLYVQEAVSKPVIQMKSLSLSSAEGFCDSVNCSVRDSWVYYTCDQTQCSETEPRSWPDVNITVTVYNGNIICTGSNQVSNKTQSAPCIVPPSLWYIWVILSILSIFCLCIGFIYFKRRCNMCIGNSEGELSLDGANNTYMMSSTADRAFPPNTPQDNTVYCTVGHPMDLPPRTPPPALCDDMSVYSQVKK